MALCRLAVGLIFTLLSSSLLAVSLEKPSNHKAQHHEKLIQEESKSNCPEFCTCVRKNDDGVIVKCERITTNQQFDDRYSDFKLSNDSGNAKEAITLDDRFFVHLQLKSVRSISIADIEIKSIDNNAFKELHDLVLVNLTNNLIDKIHPDTFVSNKNMRQLSLSGNPLALGGTMNKSLNILSLVELDLSSCKLNTLTNVFFSKLTTLVYLNLASNNLDAIDSDTFRNLTMLEELDLSNNNIHSLNGDLFIYNEALAHLTLRNNPLVTVENILLPGVFYLDLSFCKFTQISENSFNGVVGATNLNLSHNAIADISVNAFAKITKLAYLDLSNNSLDSPLDDNLFVKNNQLETLSLKNNPDMKQLPKDGFKGSLDEFFKLNIANCGIESLSSGSLKNLPNLSQLDLSRNLMTSFNGDNIIQPSVKHLNLALNRITDSTEIRFPERSQLRKLSIAGNKIKHLQTHFFDNLQFLASLDLSDCEMEQVWQNQLDKIHALPKINTINLSGNHLKKLTRQDLEVFSNLQMLNLKTNPLVCDTDLKDLVEYLSEARVGSFDTRHASEATTENLSWKDFLLTVGCTPNTLAIKGARMTDYEGKDSSDEDVGIKCFDYYDDDYEAEEREEEEEEEEEKEEKEDQTITRNKTPKQNSETSAQDQEVGSSVQIIVMLVAAITTFVVIVACVVLIILCRSRVLLHRETVAKRSGHRLNVYKPLYDHEHLNSPTTPIMKTREIVDSGVKEFSTVSV